MSRPPRRSTICAKTSTGRGRHRSLQAEFRVADGLSERLPLTTPFNLKPPAKSATNCYGMRRVATIVIAGTLRLSTRFQGECENSAVSFAMQRSRVRLSARPCLEMTAVHFRQQFKFHLLQFASPYACSQTSA